MRFAPISKESGRRLCISHLSPTLAAALQGISQRYVRLIFTLILIFMVFIWEGSC